MRAAVQLIIPGLFDLPLHELDTGFLRNELAALNRVLGLATVRDNLDFTIDAIIQRALALKSPCLAMAQAFAGDDEPDPARLILAEAVHLRADMNGAVVVPIPDTTENARDILNIINDLEALFKVDFDITPVTDSTYLIRLEEFDAPGHYPQLLSVLGKTANPYIEQSRQVLPWYRLINEIQMFMHQHAVNAERMRQGKLAINSLWFWGAGECPQLESRPQWYCDDAVLNRYAASLGLAVDSCNAIAALEKLDDTLIIDLRLLQWLKAGLDMDLKQILTEIERDLLAPVMQRFDRGGLNLRLCAGYRFDLDLRPTARFKFWRSPSSLDRWQQQTA